ncbi:MAG TPA: SDR family NAD(P)-dependent oxidoreductase, partial [Alphaproteobacteria bacterium]|nr:SDR family NAD(P)-dependent oxidoreductase [Alphaproteobacteria bacterium]
MELRVEGRRIIVTAGAAGIGRAIIGALHGAGARIHACDIEKAALDKLPRDFPGVTTSVCDVADPLAVDRLFANADTSLGGLDA